MSNVEIRQLTKKDVQAFKELRLDGLKKAPDAFGASYEQEIEQDDTFFEGRIVRSIIVGCFVDRDLVGVTCCLPDTGLKCKHTAVIWGVYLKKSYREQGLAKGLFENILNLLPNCIEQVRLSVGAHNEKAKKLYESFGFKKYGYEERILKIGDKYYDEILMVKFLK